MSKIEANNQVEPGTLETYENIDPMHVLKELLLFKGLGPSVVYGNSDKGFYGVKLSELEKMALVAYGLNSNSTNKIHVGFRLEKFTEKVY